MNCSYATAAIADFENLFQFCSVFFYPSPFGFCFLCLFVQMDNSVSTPTTDIDDGDFGDFQTFANSNKQNAQYQQTNIFEQDLFDFKTFVTNLEENIANIYVNEHLSKEQLYSHNVDPVFAIRSQEDIINDCPYVFFN